MKKNSPLKIVLIVVGAVVVVGTIAAAVIHFWDDIKKLLPGGKNEEDFDEFAELED